jgi:hypothetical protein
MAIIAQRGFFSWDEVEASSDLERLQLVLDSIPDEKLMKVLEKERKERRNDYPLRAVWNSVVAGIVFQHGTVESLRRELKRNGELRYRCGFDPMLGEAAVPPEWVYTRFLKKLMRHEDLVREMFDVLVEKLTKELPGFGKRLAVDGKALATYARKRGEKGSDGRSEREADVGIKTYGGVRADGTFWEKVKKWFGYQVVLMVETDFELPVAYEVTKASASEVPLVEPMLKGLKERHGELLEKTEYLSGDKGYDSGELHETLWEEHGIKGVIDTRELWKGEKGESRGLDERRADTIVYTERGEVKCRCQDTKKEEENYADLVFEGFEADRKTLKYRCPAAAKGIPCTQRDFCNGGDQPEYGRIVRIPLDKDRRIFTPVSRSSLKWKREYKHRTAVERVNSRLDTSFGFEHHTIRGKAKMQVRVGLALVVMLSMALGRVRRNQEDRMRSLVKAA